MDPNLLQLLVCAGLTLLGVILVAIMWPRAKWRTIVWWLGASMLPIGVYLMGLAPTMIELGNMLSTWWSHAVLDPRTIAGLVLVGLGVLLILVSRVIPAKPRRRKTANAGKGTPPPAAAKARPLYDSPTPSQPTSQSTPSENS